MKRKRPERKHTGNGRARGCAHAGCEHNRIKGATKCEMHVINYDKSPRPPVPLK